MDRRNYLKFIGVATTGACAGCASSTTGDTSGTETDEGISEPECSKDFTPCPELTHRPSKPTVGQPVLFDASDTRKGEDEKHETLYYLWQAGNNTETDVPRGSYYMARGPKITHSFLTKGYHTINVIATTGDNIEWDEDAFPNVGLGYERSDQIARASETVEVVELSQKEIDRQNENVNISLKAAKQAVTVDSQALLRFSIANLVGNNPLIAQLILELPSGLTVSNSSFNQGGAQFSSEYRVAPGETKSERIRISASDTGPYRVTGYVVYYSTENEENRNTTEQTEIELRFYEKR